MRALVVAIIVACQLHGAESRAQPSPQATEQAALVHLDRGVAAFNAKDFQKALVELTAAHELVPDKANPYRWLALTQIQLGNCADALVNIDGFVSRVPPSDPRVAEMVRWREFCRREPGQTGTDTTTGQVTGTQVTGTQGLAPGRPPESRPLRQRWWFWPLVGTAAVAITGAVVYVATDRSGETMLPAIHCDSTGCHP